MDNIRVRDTKNGKRFQARVYIDGTPKAKTFDTEAEAKRWVAKQQLTKIVHDGENRNSVRGITLGNVLDAYEEAYKKHSNMSRVKAATLNRLRTHLGDLDLATLKERDLMDYFLMRSETLAPATLANEVFNLKVAWERAYDWSKLAIDRALVQRVYKTLADERLVGAAVERDRRPTDEELAKLQQHFDTSPYLTMPMSDMMWFSIYTAVRISELTSLRRSDWSNTNAPTIIIRDRKNPGKHRKKQRYERKNDMAIPLLGEANAILQRQPVDPENPDLFFPYKQNTISTSFMRICRKLEIENLHWHDLRHEGISRLFERGWTIPQVARVSGHKTWKMLQRYTQLRAEDLHELPY